MRNKKTIKEKVFGEIFEDWDDISKGVVVARNKLKKMFIVDYPMLADEDIEEKRLILHNLAVSEIEIERKKGLEVYEMESVKLYTAILKNEMDKIKGYKEGENACLYARVLINYIESHKKILPKEELKKAYELCYRIYEKIEDKNEYGYLNKLVAKFNLYLFIENFNVVLEILEDILHNNDAEYQKKFNELVYEIKTINKPIYRKALLLKQLNMIQDM